MMEGLVNPTLLASATASATGASVGLDATAFKAAVDSNLETLDLKMAFGISVRVFEVFGIYGYIGIANNALALRAAIVSYGH